MKRWGVILIILWASVAWADPFCDGFLLPIHGATKPGYVLTETQCGYKWVLPHITEIEFSAHDGDLLEITHDEEGFILPVGSGDLTADLATEIEWGTRVGWAEDYYNMQIEFIDSGVKFSIAQIVEYLETAVELIGPINEVPSPTFYVTDSVYRVPPKPSDALKNKSKSILEKAEELELREGRLKKIKDFIKQLRRIEE